MNDKIAADLRRQSREQNNKNPYFKKVIQEMTDLAIFGETSKSTKGKEECFFCYGGERLMPDTIQAIDDHLKCPVDLKTVRCCALCIKILCMKAVKKVTF